MESSRRELLNDAAEHRSSLKTDENTYYTRFSFTPKTGIEIPKWDFFFLLCNLGCNIRGGESDVSKRVIRASATKQ